MNAIDFAEVRMMLDGFGMRDWTIQRDMPDHAIHMNSNAVFHLEKRNAGVIIGIYYEMNDKPDRLFVWHICIQDTETNGTRWFYHEELKPALRYLSTIIHREG